jgi:hypothetical protein
MNKLLRFGCFIILLHTIIIGSQEPQAKMQYASFDRDMKISKNQDCGEGFLEGTLIKTIKRSSKRI